MYKYGKVDHQDNPDRSQEGWKRKAIKSSIGLIKIKASLLGRPSMVELFNNGTRQAGSPSRIGLIKIEARQVGK